MSRIVPILILLSLCAVTALQAQNSGTIEGQIIDSQSMEALAGVNVTLQGTTYGAATGVDGNYRISGVPAGTYTLQASYLGFQPFEQDIDLDAGQTITVDIEMQETTLLSDELVVTGSRRPEKLLDSPITIERVSAEDIELTGGPTFLASLSNLKGV